MTLRSLFSIVMVVALASGVYYVSSTVPILTGYCAKYVCSAHFVSGREVESVVENDLPLLAKLLHLGMHTNRPGCHVSVRVLGHDLWRVSAYYRKGLGCTLHLTQEEEEAQPYTFIEATPKVANVAKPWPHGDDHQATILPKVQAVLEAYVKQNNASFATRQIAVVHNGLLVGEAHAPGFPSDMPLLGWSMTKSVVNYFVGRLVQLGKMKISDKAFPLLPHSDPRSAITIDHLLRMSSGLKFSEVYSRLSDATQMLFKEKSTGVYASEQSLQGAPDTIWEYSSGTSNILSLLVMRAVGGTLGDYYKWTRDEFFGKLGLHSGIIEPDASGNFVGSSFMWATASDWAKFGQLYLQDGVWEGEQLLPKDWANYSATPTPHSNNQYGAHFWLTDLEGFHPDAYYARGFQGQAICISPKDNLVIVRLGLDNFAAGARKWEPVGLYRDILHSLIN